MFFEAVPSAIVAENFDFPSERCHIWSDVGLSSTPSPNRKCFLPLCPVSRKGSLRCYPRLSSQKQVWPRCIGPSLSNHCIDLSHGASTSEPHFTFTRHQANGIALPRRTLRRLISSKRARFLARDSRPQPNNSTADTTITTATNPPLPPPPWRPSSTA